jgi:hypothetical protein
VISCGNDCEAAVCKSNSSLSSLIARLTRAICSCCEVVVFTTVCSCSSTSKFENGFSPLILGVDCRSDVARGCRRR